MRPDVRAVVGVRRTGARRTGTPGAWLVAPVLGLVLVASCGTSAGPAAQATWPTDAGSPSASAGVDLDAYAAALVEGTVQARRAADLDTVVTSACAAQAAVDRARALVGHPLEHASLAPVLQACAPASTAAENLSRAPAAISGPSEVVEAWLGSPGHRANLLDPELTEVGVACVRDDTDADTPQVLCSQVFLGP